MPRDHIVGLPYVRDHRAMREAGEALYGALWQSPLARDLNVSVRTMQRWAAGEFAIPDGVWAELAKLCRRRGLELAAIADKLR